MMNFYRLITLLLFSLCLGLSSNISAEEKWSPKDDDLRILEVRVSGYQFDDVLISYQYEDIVLLPLGALAEMLDLAIRVGPDSANGFVIKEERTLFIDVSRSLITLSGKTQSYEKHRVHIVDGDIYVDSSLLSRWLEMTLEVNLFASRISISSDTPLPFLAKIERENRIAKALSRLNVEKQIYPKHHEAYQNVSTPFIDQTVRVEQRKNSDGSSSSTFQYTTHATADLLKHESSWFLAGNNQDSVETFRATFGRKDPDAKLLGALQAREYSFGYIVEPRLNLITSAASTEPGISISNFNISQQIEYDRHRFRGPLLPGWEVELYRNNSIIGYQAEAIEGEYDFQDVPLLFGSNNFRLVFYGPQGQIQEETKQFILSQALTKEGEHYYRATASSDEIDGSRVTARYDFGINKNLSTSFNLASIPLQNGLLREQHNYLTAGLVGFWQNLFAKADLISDLNGGNAFDLGFQTRISDTILGFNDTEFSNFVSEELSPSSALLARRTKFRIDTSIPPGFLPRIPFALEIRREEFANGGELTEITNEISANTRGFSVTHLLSQQKLTGQQDITNGTLQLSTNINQFRLRGVLNYQLKPESELSNLALTIDPGIYEGYNISYGINHSLINDVTDYSVTASKNTGKYNIGLGARFNTNDEISIHASLSFGIGHDPRTDQWQTNSRTIANQGSVSTQVFLDNNQDGLFDKDTDLALPDIAFKINNGYQSVVTNDNGTAFLTGIPPYRPINITIAQESISDPLWTPAIEGIQTIARPGHTIKLDFPIFMSGEIDGTIYLKKKDKTLSVGNVIIELIDQNQHIIKTTKSAYDGFYILSNIPIGEYYLQISDKYLENKNLHIEEAQAVKISTEKLFLSGRNFTLISD